MLIIDTSTTAAIFLNKKDVRSRQNERSYKLLPIKLYVFQKYTLLLICLFVLNSHTTYTDI